MGGLKRLGTSIDLGSVDMATNRMRAIHPGEILREEYLVPLNMTAHALVMELHAPASRINDIVRERRAVTPDDALRLARYFGTTAQFWLNLQRSYDLKRAESYEIDDGQLAAEDIKRLRKGAEPMLPKGKLLNTRSLVRQPLPCSQEHRGRKG